MHPGAKTSAPPKRKVPPSAPKERQSKLAKEHNITAREEAEIKEAFALFSEPMDGEKEGVIPIGDVKRAMIALNIPPTRPELKEFLEILDPDGEGHASYEPFLAICALKLHQRDDDASGEAHAAEVDEAFALFTGSEGMETLTLGHLKRVAMTLKQDVDEELLRDMILEANYGAGVGKGVGRREFEEVMRRAGELAYHTWPLKFVVLGKAASGLEAAVDLTDEEEQQRIIILDCGDSSITWDSTSLRHDITGQRKIRRSKESWKKGDEPDIS
ncbi:putative Calmodulin [Seiridium cardinale]